MWSITNHLVVFVVGAVVNMATRGKAKPTLHKIGDSEYGWNQNTNYTLWSSSHHFHVGDWLYFGFDKRYYNVLEVNKTSYESCNDKGFIKNITRGGRDVFELTEARPYYFLSGGGYCYHGMRVAVFVSAADDHHRSLPPGTAAAASTSTSPAPAPSPATTLARPALPRNASTMSRDNHMSLYAMLSMTFLWTILF